MRMKRSVSALLLLITAASAYGQVVIFDNDTGSYGYAWSGGGSVGFPCTFTFGNLVTAGESARTVVALDTWLDLYNGPREVELRLRFYEVGAGNSVGAQIGTVTTVPSFNLALGLNNLSFSGMSVTVPDSFIWAVTVACPAGPDWVGYYTRTGSTPTVGSSGPAYSSGEYLNIGQGPMGFGNNQVATISAVPEPGWAGSAFGVLALLTGLAIRSTTMRRMKC